MVAEKRIIEPEGDSPSLYKTQKPSITPLMRIPKYPLLYIHARVL